MRFNIGPTKSAVLAWGAGRIPDAASFQCFTIAGQTLPVVQIYKYLGILISAGSGWSHQVAHMNSKMITKTGEILHWSRCHCATLDVSLRLWSMYVLRAAVFGAALVGPAPSILEALDRCQRKVGRMLLGFDRQSPSPAVLAELGWKRLSAE
eukprot:6825836-Karenia_brevis.AAC.1